LPTISRSSISSADGVAKAVAGRVEVSKQAFDILFRRIAAGRGFDSGKDSGKIGVQALVCIGGSDDVRKQLAGVDKVAFGFNGINLGLVGDVSVGHTSIIDAVVIGLDVVSEIFANETLKMSTQNKLLEVPAVNCAPHSVGDLPNLTV
jgi:hypothetical protein